MRQARRQLVTTVDGNKTAACSVTVTGDETPTPVASDYDIGNLKQFTGIVSAVTITPKNGKSTGAVSNIKYAGNTTIPQTVGTYAVTFDVAAATGWNAATNLSAGNLIISDVIFTAVADSTLGNSSFNIRAIACGNGKFVAVGRNGKMAVSTDGETWTAVDTGTIFDYVYNGTTYKYSIYSIAYGNGKFVAGSDWGKMAYWVDN